jgi:hypothetical protein
MAHGFIYLLGQKLDIEQYLDLNPAVHASADFLNLRGSMAEGKRGVGGWTWTRNKKFMVEALTHGEILLVTDPERPLHAGGNTYQRELRYLTAKGYRWERYGAHWRLVHGRIWNGRLATPRTWQFHGSDSRGHRFHARPTTRRPRRPQSRPW